MILNKNKNNRVSDLADREKKLLLNYMANRGKGERCLNSFVHMFLVSAISVLFAGKSAEQTEE